MAKVGRSYKGLESHDSEPFLLAEAVEEDVSMKLSILTKVMTLLTRARDSWEYQKSRNGLFLRKQKVGDEGLEPFALGFHDCCYSAVFPVFPMVPTWFAIHSKSLQFTAITGKVWAKCGHGWARLTRSSVVRGIGAPTVPPHGSPPRRQAAEGSQRSCRARRVPASLSRRVPAAIRRRR